MTDYDWLIAYAVGLLVGVVIGVWITLALLAILK